MKKEKMLWAYNFEGGGGNQTYAFDLEEAKENVRKEWANSQGLLDKVRWNTFRAMNEEEARKYYRMLELMYD